MTTLVLKLTVKEASQLEHVAKSIGVPRESVAKAALRMLLRSCAPEKPARRKKR